MKRKIYVAIAFVALFLSNTCMIDSVYAGSYYPKLTELYTVDVSCYFIATVNTPPEKQYGVYMNYSTDLSIRNTGDICHARTLDIDTTCAEDLTDYEEVISNAGMCEQKLNVWGNSGEESAGIDALCRGDRDKVVNMVFELCSIMMSVD